MRFFGYRSGKKAPCESVWSPLASRRFAPVFGVTRKDSSPDFRVFCRNESKNLRLGIKSWILRKKRILSVLLGQKIFTFVEELTQYWHVLESTENHDNEGKKRSRPAEKLNRGTQQLKGNFQFIFFHLFHYRIYYKSLTNEKPGENMMSFHVKITYPHTWNDHRALLWLHDKSRPHFQATPHERLRRRLVFHWCLYNE